MAFVKNDTNQISLDDSTFILTEREKKFLEKSWAKSFAEIIFPAIREEDFSVLYSNKSSRPNTPVNVIVGALILKELLGITDDEVLESLMFDIRFQYALHTTSFKEQPLSDRTLSRFRERCLTYETLNGQDLVKQCITGLAKELSQVMNITPSMSRMDSLMIASNIKKLSRLELFYVCVANMVKHMEKVGDTVPKALVHYLDERDYNKVVYHMKSVEVDERIKPILADIALLIKLCEGNYDDCSEYQLLLRLINEQTTTQEDGSLSPKEKGDKAMESTLLISPVDPEATLRKKGNQKYIGYAANITESVGKTGSLVMNYAYEQNIYSDSHFLQDYLNQLPIDYEGGILVADGAYAGQNTTKLAKEYHLDIITTNFTGYKPADCFAEFQFSEDGKSLLRCANNIEPIRQTYDGHNDRCNAKFPLESCTGCPHFEACNPRIYKKHTMKEISWKAVKRAEQLRLMKTEKYKMLADFRNGVEAIPSLLRRKYNVDKMPVRGKKATKLFFGFKIAALNFKKLLSYFDSLDQCASEMVLS